MTPTPRKVLVIAYYFPPLGLSGVQRTTKFVKYLPSFGWKPTVLTVAPTGYYALDPSLLLEVEGIEIVRTMSLDANAFFRKKGVVKMPSERIRKMLQFAGDLLFIPDTKIGWKSRAVKAGKDLLKREQFDVIFATAPPQTDFLIGMELKKASGLPLVLDYRDAWLDYPFKYFPTPLHKYLNFRLEKKVLAAADRVVVTHRRVKESILKRYRTLNYNDVSILQQGYDPDDFQFGRREPLPSHDCFRITHAGTLYAGRNPAALLSALRNLLKESPQLEQKIELCLIGNARREDQLLVHELGLQKMVKFLGYLDHRECTKYLVASDVLYLVLDNDFQSPGKLYEYLGARKPILAAVVDGYIKELVQDSGASVIVPLHDVAGHEQAVRELFRQYEKKKLKQVSAEFSQQFSRVTLTGELAKQFESLMDIDRHGVVRVEEHAA
jgi:glycosyltransferase involved in cell wall biosynthesis